MEGSRNAEILNKYQKLLMKIIEIEAAFYEVVDTVILPSSLLAAGVHHGSWLTLSYASSLVFVQAALLHKMPKGDDLDGGLGGNKPP